MQLSEVSELRSLIGLMRINTCNSPHFHDRQDSEVDRIYNSSPKVASYELRSSWLDRPSIQMAMPNQTATIASSHDGSPSPKPKPPTVKQPSTEAKDKQTNGKPKVVVFDKKKASKSDGSAGDGDEDSFVFEREPVESIRVVESSLLDLALRGGAMGGALAMGANKPPIDSPVIEFKIYLPNRDEMPVDLYEVSTVEESIHAILAAHQNEGREPKLYYGHPECYELRLHDADGYPDEDFPALDRSRKIKNFGGHEFCLCERPEACPPQEGATASFTAPVVDTNRSFHLGQSEYNTRPRVPQTSNFLKIIMPNENYSVIPIKDDTTGKDLLPQLTRKHRLPMLDEYILKVSEAEKVRLELPSEIIDLDRKLKPLGLQEVTLARRVYADAPVITSAPSSETLASSSSVDSTINKNVRPPPSTFMYNDVKAAMYKEWRVIKTNKYGKRQHRMLGLDSHKVYNSKVGERAMISRTNIKVAERPISSITWLRFLNDPCDFQIHYSQPDEETIEYTAASAYECAEIVAKIKYIQEMNKRK
ncbi:hypothetical protein Ae201684P_016671 [Aphanomyces euteiches]|nr:hypothetical protein Ae201684P_016671 [Aphanomyces euteiches]KAH9153983.1 hypothetical protein AeRB84_003848 [Aphanomyces euteiches]